MAFDMGIRRVIYASVIIGSAIFYVLYSHWFSWYLLVLLLLLLPFDFIFSLPGMITRRIILTAPRVLEKGSEGTLEITTLQKKLFPARCIKTWLWVHGDDFAILRRLMCGAEHGSRYEIAIDTSHSGLTVFEIKRFWTVSLIGLFSVPSSITSKAAVLTLPAPIKPQNIIALPRGVILRPKLGGGFSEDYDLRQYRQGDPIRSIHWKVSAKHDTLIIREPLVPPSHSRLIHVTKWDGPKERDLILSRLRWISNYLFKWELPYFIRFGDDGPIAEITKDEELADYLYFVLAGMAHTLPKPVNIPARFTWVFRIDAKDQGAEIRNSELNA